MRDSRRRYRIPTMMEEIIGQPGTFKTAAEAYTILGKYDEAKSSLMQLLEIVKQNSGDPAVSSYQNYIQRNVYDIIGQMYSIDNDHISALIKHGKKDEAIKLANDLLVTYKKSGDPLFQQLSTMIDERLQKILGKSDTTLVDSVGASTASANDSAVIAN